jgi:hypothetical protein
VGQDGTVSAVLRTSTPRIQQDTDLPNPLPHTCISSPWYSVQNGLTPARLEPLFQHLLVQIVGEAGALPSIPPSGKAAASHLYERRPGWEEEPSFLTHTFGFLSSQTISLLL